jgi:septal ring factor EnvC (AmiA/AmiB activator)
LLLLTGPLLKVAILSNKSKKTQRIKTKTFKKINPRIQKEIPNLKKTRQQAKKKNKNIYAKQIRKLKKKV